MSGPVEALNPLSDKHRRGAMRGAPMDFLASGYNKCQHKMPDGGPCPMPGLFAPVLVLPAADEDKATASIRLRLGLRICSIHKDYLKLQDVCNDDSWLKILLRCQEQGSKLPVKEKAFFNWIHIA